jgi:IS1 family transposase
MNRLSLARRAQVLGCLVEGNSIRSTVRLTGVAKNTVSSLLRSVGAACLRYQDETLINLPVRRVQCDEIWSFVACKDKQVENVKDSTRENGDWLGDVWTWTALDPDSKVMVAWHVGEREAADAHHFMRMVASRVRKEKGRKLQITTDGLSLYLTAVEDAFGWGRCDYAQVIKEYGCYVETEKGERRYSPSTCTGYRIVEVMGEPHPDHISTSLVERSNLTMRMGMRRFTRLTNAFSKRVENHVHAISLHFMHYHFSRRHQTLGTTPAFRLGIASHVWSMKEIAELPERYAGETDMEQAA